MCVIGITGGIASGKSVVTKILKEKFNAAIIDTDSISHDIVDSEPAYSKIIREFGTSVSEKGKINRSVLGNIVFNDNKKLKKLNDIVHPAVEEEVDKRIAIFKKKYKYIALETALLIKVGYNTKCDKIWYVHADEKVRLERLIKNRNITKEKAVSIFENQNTEDEFKAIADDIINNSTSVENLENQIKDILESYKGGNNARVT